MRRLPTETVASRGGCCTKAPLNDCCPLAGWAIRPVERHEIAAVGYRAREATAVFGSPPLERLQRVRRGLCTSLREQWQSARRAPVLPAKGGRQPPAFNATVVVGPALRLILAHRATATYSLRLGSPRRSLATSRAPLAGCAALSTACDRFATKKARKKPNRAQAGIVERGRIPLVERKSPPPPLSRRVLRRQKSQVRILPGALRGSQRRHFLGAGGGTAAIGGGVAAVVGKWAGG